MVGYDTEDKAYCMELTYNYGLDSYTPGTGLKEFGIYTPDVTAAVAAAKSLQYEVVDADAIVVGPDQYRFRLLPMPEGRTEHFLYVLCRVASLERSVAFYREYLGFSDAEVPNVPGMPAKTAAVSYASASHPHKGEPVLLVFYEDGVVPKIQPWEGRHAFALDADEVNRAHKKFKADRPESIMHDSGEEPISLQEKLGTLFIFIAKDPDGYELCLVSRETMLPATIEAVTNYDPKLLDWSVRDSRIAAIEEAGKEVDKLVKEHPVVIFSKEWCPFCKKAKDAFADIEANVFVKELEDTNKQAIVASPAAFQDSLAAKTNVGRSVPKVFIQGTFVGGGDDVAALHKSGQLLTKCVAAGARAAPAKVDVSETNTHYFVNGTTASKEDYDAAQL
mmetsp:Transcript_73629/g.157952  ORF Transcript_73629/g.157952 Transcript_73629/m.157952 type:complete len:391 (-) Transcript_73629:355-1527(-)